MVKVKIYSKRGKRFYKVLEGKMYCLRMRQYMRNAGQYSGKLPDGVHKVKPTSVGYDHCDTVR